MKRKRIGFYFLAFLLPALLMVMVYACMGIFPFGKKSLLTVDLAGQYVAFFNAFQNVASGGINAFYSFSKTLGGNLFGLITYYLLSPFNLILLLFSKTNITEAIFLINVLKIGACGLTSYIYFRKTFKDNTITPIAFSTVYALCSYNIVYSQNLLWLDGVIMLPLVFLGIDKLIEEKKPLFFYLMLVITILSNYYIGYMVCLASLFYYLYKIYLYHNFHFNLKENKKEFWYFIKYSLLAAGTTMIVLLPSIFSLLSGKAGAGLQELIPKQTFPLLDLVSRFFIGAFRIEDLSGGCPNIFISLAMITLAISYFFNQKIKKEEKKASLSFVLFFLASFLVYSIDIIWHLFQHPAGFPARYSFIFDFLLLILGYKSYQNLNGVKTDTWKKMIPGILLVALIMDKLMYQDYMYYAIVASGILMVGYVLYFCYKKEKAMRTLLIFVILLEMSINSILVVYKMEYQDRNTYVHFVDQYGGVVDGIKERDDSFYRIEKDTSYSTNDPLLLNYNGISHFSSIYESANNDLLGAKLGIFNRFYITNHIGSTLVTDSIFNIKYLLSEDRLEDYQLQYKEKELYVYQNQYALPLGFMVNRSVLNLELEDLEPFQNQNQILNSMSGVNENVFYPNTNVSKQMQNVKEKTNGTTHVLTHSNPNLEASISYRVTASHTGRLYAYISSRYDKKIDILVDGESIIDTGDQNAYHYNILDLGYHMAGDTFDFDIVLIDETVRWNDVMFYTLDMEKFENHMNLLQQKNALHLEEFKGNSITANATVDDRNSILYTSIPYDKGWIIKVDDKIVEPVKIFDTLMGLELEPGNHKIEMEYHPRGLYVGGVISLISVGLFVSFRIIDRKKTRLSFSKGKRYE